MTKQSAEHADEKKSESVKQQQPNEDKNDKEIGGPKGPEPTRYGDWEKKGRCIDF